MSDLLSNSIEVCPDMWVLREFADTQSLGVNLAKVVDHAPLRQMQTSRGFYMSVKTTNCGEWGWVSDRQGYRYCASDPLTGKAWPAMPGVFTKLATEAAETVGFGSFRPDACLINQYEPGTQMGAHQDKDEADFSHPIVSVSLGIDARFFVTGSRREGKSIPVDLSNGDVLVFGGVARQYFHGVRKLKQSVHPQFGPVRWNLTFRRAR